MLKLNRLTWVALAVFLGSINVALIAAERPSNLEPLEDIPPPPVVLEGEPMEEPQITIRKNGEDTIEEYRIHGELYMMKVTPKSGVPYYLHKDDRDGGWIHDGPNPPLSVPKWIIFRF